MKIRVIEVGRTAFDADAEYCEPEIRKALGAGDGAVRSAVMDTTDTERDTDSDEYITITEDDGTVLWSGWLTGARDKPAPAGGDPADTLLALPLTENDSGASTVRGYLVALLTEVWREEENFSAKRPFGRSGWQSDLYGPMVRAGIVAGKLDEDGCLDTVDWRGADALVLAAIGRLGQ